MTAAMQEEVKIMGKYESFHFSPENNRSILMPRAPRGTEYHPPKRNRHRELFPPIPEDKLNHSSPYYQCNLGITEKNDRDKWPGEEICNLCAGWNDLKGCGDFCIPGKWDERGSIYSF